MTDVPTEGEVRATLSRLLAWGDLMRSPQLSAFLRYIVDARLDGRDDQIKAYAIAVDVLGRPESFDAQTDPIVRVQARRLRTLLDRYFADVDPGAQVVIAIPVGGYIPVFSRRTGSAAVSMSGAEAVSSPPAPLQRVESRPSTQWQSLSGIVVLAVLFWGAVAGVLVWWAGMQGGTDPRGPLVLVSEFENLTVDDRGEPVAAGLGPALAEAMDRVIGVDARFISDTDDMPAAIDASDGPVFLLHGVVRRAGADLDYSAVVSDGATGQRADDYSFVVPVVNGAPTLSLTDVANRFSGRFADYSGPLHAEAQAWLGEPDHRPMAGDVYPCMIAFTAYRRGLDPRDGAEALECARAARGVGVVPVAMAIEAGVTARHHWLFGAPVPGVSLSLGEAAALAEDAITAAPEEATTWELGGFVAMVSGQHDVARERYNTALQLNPAGLDAMASYAVLDAFAGNWAQALRRSEAVHATGVPIAAWHMLPVALDALRREAFADALETAGPIADTLPALGPVLMVAAGAQRGDSAIVGRYLPQVMSNPVFQEQGVLPALRRYLLDPNLLAEITQGLSLAGLTLDRLSGRR